MRIFLILLIIITTNVAFSQLVFEDITSITTGNSGLLCNKITNVMQDSSGTIWIHSKEGLAKYDGQTWEYFTPNNSPLQTYAECSTLDYEGNVWMSGWTTLGQVEVLKFDGTNWTGFSYPEYPAGSYYPKCCADSSGNAYFTTTSSGVAKFSDTSYVFLSSTTIGLQNDQIYSVFVDSQQQLWIGHVDGVSVYDGDTCTYIDPGNYGGGTVKCITQDVYENMWFATSYGIAKFDGANWTLFNSLQIFAYSGVDIRSLASDNSGGVWCGTFNMGLSYYNGVNWTQYDLASGLNSVYVTKICCDIENKTWFCTWDMGINQYNGQQWTYINTLDGMSNNWVNAMECSNNGAVWFGTDCGVLSFDGNDWSNYYYKFSGARIKSVNMGMDNKLWFGPDWGPSYILFHHSDTIWSGYSASWLYGQTPFYQTLADTPGTIWLATHNGLDKIGMIADSITQHSIFTTSDGLLHNRISALVRNANGDLVIGTWDGINIHDGTSFSSLSMPAIEQMSNQVTSMLLDHLGRLWVGTTEGLGCYDWQNWEIYKTTSGLADNYVNALYQSDNDSIWVATKNGISQLNGNSFVSYYKSDGLIADDITDIVEDQQGNMYFSSHYGVSKVDAGYLGSTILKNKETELYPNPAKDNITISAPSEIIPIAGIEIYNQSGQLLQKTTINKKQGTIDVSGLSPGNYFLRATGKSDVWVRKFVVIR
ncbi:MAG: two-component regulator propeller domain-containing protein [Bacteroidota bacterium]|nr:two-component regulator propeller domain-containing protein [Bacteroidota bacterium]